MESTLHKLALLVFGLMLASSLSACMAMAGGAKSAFPDSVTSADAPAPEAAPAPKGAFGDLGGAPMDQALAVNGTIGVPTSTAPANPEPPADRGLVMIYTGTFHLAVVAVADALRQIEAMARETGGFFTRRDDHSITIRVPVRKFEDTVRRIEALGDMLHRNVSVEDVTQEFTDLATRLKSARAVRDRLKELLAKSTTVADSLAIERELARVETEVDRMETRYEYLRSRASYSTITVTLQPKRFETDRAPFRIPVDWLDQLGLGRLQQLR